MKWILLCVILLSSSSFGQGFTPMQRALLDALYRKVSESITSDDFADGSITPEKLAFPYLTEEEDPVWDVQKALYYTKAEADIQFLDAGFNESDPVWTAASVDYYTSAQIDVMLVTLTAWANSFWHTNAIPLFTGSVTSHWQYSAGAWYTNITWYSHGSILSNQVNP